MVITHTQYTWIWMGTVKANCRLRAWNGLTLAVKNALTVHICLGVDRVSYLEVPKSLSPRMLWSGVQFVCSQIPALMV
jgi:hypothetical protein